jgi:hypothetical protein
MNKRDYPLSLSKDIQKVINYIKLEVVRNENFIMTKAEDGYIISLIDKQDDRFFFKIYSPNISSDLKSYFYCDFSPYNETTLKRKEVNTNFEELKIQFEKWLTIIKEYNEVTFTEEDYFTKKYEDEFYADFEIIEEDAEINPFEHKQQVFIYNLLEYVEVELQKNESNDEEIAQLISETIQLKNNIQNLTKKVVVRKMSIIFSKIKKKSLKLFTDIIDVAKKEIIKKVLYGGIDELHQLTNHFW